MIYADYAATTPLDSLVFEHMRPYLTDCYYNPSALYPEARQAYEALGRARKQTADLIGAPAERIVFTSGGTEGDNLAVLGTALHAGQHRRHLITSAIEHHAILETCAWLEPKGFRVTRLPVDSRGLVNPRDLEKAMTKDTFLVSVMWVNNELGTVQDIPELARIAHAGGALFHTDAVQAVTTQDIDVEAAGIDMLTLSSHKFYGPKGAGALYVREGVPISPMQHGGQQEYLLRGGTENVPALIGMGAAAQRLKESGKHIRSDMARWKKRLIRELTKVEGIRINSPCKYTADSILHLAVEGIEAEGMLFWLARAGVQASMGSACNSSSVEPSHVVRAIGLSEKWARGCVRLSFGCGLTDEKIDELIKSIIGTVKHLQNAGKR